MRNNDFEKVLNERIKFIARSIGCTEEEARIIVELDVKSIDDVKNVLAVHHPGEKTPASVADLGERRAAEVRTTPQPKAPTKSKIGEEDLTALADVIKENFADKPFANKDLAPFLSDLGLTGRQTPSRLKKLAEMGILSDEGGSPKKYKLV